MRRTESLTRRRFLRHSAAVLAAPLVFQRSILGANEKLNVAGIGVDGDEAGDRQHRLEWIEAAKGGPAALSNFEYAGPLAEVALLGNVALRAGKRIEWDSLAMRIPNAPHAEAFLRKSYRKGWEIG